MMNYKILKTLVPFVLITLFMLSGSILFSQGKPEKEKVEKKAKRPKKAKRGKSSKGDTLEIETMKSLKYSIKKDQTITYSYKEHASVGITEDYIIENTAILTLSNKKILYKNPNREGLAGADEARVTLYFKGVESGTSKLTIREIDKGQIKKIHEIEIKVE